MNCRAKYWVELFASDRIFIVFNLKAVSNRVQKEYKKVWKNTKSRIVQRKFAEKKSETVHDPT